MQKAVKRNTITVGKTDEYNFNTIQEAVDSISEIPTKECPTIIKIYGGTYEEAITVDLPYVRFENADIEKEVIITYDKAVNHTDPEKSFGTEKTATVTISKNAVGFSAENITFQNSYNLDENLERNQSQAVALVSLADKVVFNNCKFIGRQDTLYLKGASKGESIYGSANSARVYLKDCYIEGTVDYIFGDATAYFDKCKLNLAYYKNGGHFTAANTTLFNIGYVFNECELTVDSRYTQADAAKIDLGRPWQSDNKYLNYGANVVYINCKLPKILKNDLFSVWDENTVKNKVRFFYYNSREKVNLSDDAKWIKILNDEQAKAYLPRNVLGGSDSWNPAEDTYSSVKVCDITFDKYNLDIPNGQTDKIKAFILPQNVKNKKCIWQSSNEDVASVDKDGNIKALKQGQANITATTQDGQFYATATVNVVAPKTPVPEISRITIEGKEPIYPGSTLKLIYDYVLESDNEIDNATIKWYAVDKNEEKILIKEGKGNNYKQYIVSDADVNYKIKAEIVPETITTYGTKGGSVSSITNVAVSKPDSNIPKVYLREGFENFYEEKYKEENSDTYPIDLNSNPVWIGNGWAVVDNDGNPTISSDNDGNTSSFIEYSPSKYNYQWGAVNISMRMRFNPEGTGLTSDCYHDIYSAYNGKNGPYYKLRMVRGGNTKSLKLYLYKKADEKSEEVLIASDEKSLSNKIYQNSKQENNWFTINQVIDNGNIDITFYNEDDKKTLLNLSVIDDNPISSGFIAFESFGKNQTLLISNIEVLSVVHDIDDGSKTRIYLAGDSTVKSYGSDNTIGGWGEFLPYYFNNDTVEIINRAEGGRSSRSYINEGRLDKILSEIRPGDYLFIQFGHNDGLTIENTTQEQLTQHAVALGEPNENGIYPISAGVKEETPDWIYNFYKDSEYPYQKTFYPWEGGTYKWFLKQYVVGAREKGAIPILITPVARVFFDSDGKITPHHGLNDGYVKAVLQVADELDAECIDLFNITKSMYEDYGVKVTQGLQNIKSDGSMDITHYNKFGSNIVTSLLVKALQENNIYIANQVVSSSRFVSKTEDLKKSNVFIVGDSTVSADEYDEDYYISKTGWINYFKKYFVDLLDINNLAMEQQSSKSFIKTENYRKMLNSVKEGDYVLVQFGIDDLRNSDYEESINFYTNALGGINEKGSFKYYLYNYYVKPVLEKKAIPLLITPITNIKLNNSDYVNAVKELSSEEELYYIDLNGAYSEYCNEIGQTYSNGLYAINKNYGIDYHNFNKYGAAEAARLLISQIKYCSATLKNYIDNDVYDASAESNVLKADYVNDIISLMNYKAKSDVNFTDVVKGKYYERAFSIAKMENILTGDIYGKINPEEYLTKSELMSITKNVLKYKNKQLDESVFNNIQDDSFVSNKDAYYIISVVDGIINNR